MRSPTHSKSNRRAPLWSAEPPQLRHIDPPAQLLVPLSSHGDALAAVKPPGTRLRQGDALVEMAPASAHVPLAPVDGQLGTTQTVTLTNGRATLAVQLFCEPGADCQPNPPPSQQHPTAAIGDPSGLVEWIDRLRNAGVWADRHDSPDLIGQLNQVVSRPVDTILCTLLDADANLRLNAALAARHADLVTAGIALLMGMTGAPRGIIAVELDAGPSWIASIRAAARSTRLELVEMNNDYPQADPTLMLYSVLQRRLRPGNLPTTQGALVLDAAAALDIGRAACGEKALRTPIAIHDHARRQSYLLSVPVGATIGHVLDQLGMAEPGLVLRGGDLLRDVRLSPQTIIGGAELTVHVTAPELTVNPEPCVRCAWCVEACPTLVQPAAILEAAQRHDRLLAERAGIGACIECGLCSHVCPSGLPLLESIRRLRAMIADGIESTGWER